MVRDSHWYSGYENAGRLGQVVDEAANDCPTARQSNESDAVAILRLRLQVAREERLAMRP